MSGLKQLCPVYDVACQSTRDAEGSTSFWKSYVSRKVPCLPLDSHPHPSSDWLGASGDTSLGDQLAAHPLGLLLKSEASEESL